MNNNQLEYKDVGGFFKNKKLSFYKRTEYFHATNGISSATDEETGKTLKGQIDTNLLQDLPNLTTMKSKDIVWTILDSILKEFKKHEQTN